MTIIRSTFISDSNDTWHYTYDGRYRSLQLVCKRADGNKSTIQIADFDMKVIDDVLVILSNLKNELWPKDKLV